MHSVPAAQHAPGLQGTHFCHDFQLLKHLVIVGDDAVMLKDLYCMTLWGLKELHSKQF